MSRLAVNVAGLVLKNPTILASGVMGETAESLLRVAEAEAGAVVTKSIGMEPRKGYQNPTLVELKDGYLNAMGLPNPGIDLFCEEMDRAKSCPVPIVASVFASKPEEFSFLSKRLEEHGAAAIELNLSCPHAHGFGMEVGVDPEAVAKIVSSVKASVTVPVFAKLTPNTHRLLEVAKAAQNAGGDGIVAINTLKAMSISVEFKRPILSNRAGGLSGPSIKPVGIRCVYDLYEEIDIPIIGVGGIETGLDAVEYFMAGASGIQIGSAVGRMGLGVFKTVQAEISQFMISHDYGDIVSMVGAAHD